MGCTEEDVLTKTLEVERYKRELRKSMKRTKMWTRQRKRSDPHVTGQCGGGNRNMAAAFPTLANVEDSERGDVR